MRTSTTRSGIRIGRRGNVRAISHEDASAGLPLRTPMPPPRPTPTRRSIKAIELCRSCCRANAQHTEVKMKERRNAAVSILICLTLVLPCIAQTSQVEKEILDLEQKMNASYAANDL